jgi:hypothetical protein
VRQADRKHAARDFATILMLAAVAGAVAQLVGAVIKIGQAAGWWN